MTAPDHGVDLLLRRATDDLRPDIDHLVAAGITRGRARQRRARIGTAVATVAVFGVIGVAAAVVPQLGPSGARSGDTGFASESPSPTYREVPPPATTPVDAELAVQAADLPAMVNQVLGTTSAGAPVLGEPYGVTDEPRHKIVHFRYDGMLTTMVIEAFPGALEACELSETCVVRADGSLQNSWGPTTADGVTSSGVTVFRHGYAINVLSYNAAEGKDSPPLAPEPALSKEQLLLVAGSDVWFALGATEQ